MEFEVLATKWNNRFSNMCPCGCPNRSPYAAQYRITIVTKTMYSHGDPLVREVKVYCTECYSSKIYDVDDGYSRASDFDIR